MTGKFILRSFDKNSILKSSVGYCFIRRQSCLRNSYYEINCTASSNLEIDFYYFTGFFVFQLLEREREREMGREVSVYVRK